MHRASDYNTLCNSKDYIMGIPDVFQTFIYSSLHHGVLYQEAAYCGSMRAQNPNLPIGMVTIAAHMYHRTLTISRHYA